MSAESVKFVLEVDSKGAITSIKKLETATKNSTDKMSSSFDKVKSFAKAAAVPIIALTVVYKSLEKLIKESNLGDVLRTQEEAFTNLTSSHGLNSKEIISNLKTISNETIVTTDLMRSAGQAILLGVDPTKIASLMRIARATMKITGQTATEAFNDIVVAVGRQSAMILDNLGIIVKLEEAYKNYARQIGKTVDELTDAEKKQAFLNETLIKGEESIKRIGEETGNQREGVKKLGVAWKDFSDEGAKALSVIFGGAINDVSEKIAALLKQMQEATKTLTNMVTDGLRGQASEAAFKKFPLLERGDKRSFEDKMKYNKMRESYRDMLLSQLQLQAGIDKTNKKLLVPIPTPKPTPTPDGYADDYPNNQTSSNSSIDDYGNDEVQAYVDQRLSDLNNEKLALAENIKLQNLMEEAVEDTYDVDMGPYLSSVDEAGEATKSFKDIFMENTEEMATSLSFGMTDALFDWIDGTKSASDSFRDFAASFLKQIAKMIIQQAILNALQGSDGSGGIFGMIGGLIPSAKGNVFNNGNVIPFAKGGIVNKPTIFPMANGAGLMGEAGPEAIMPLKRGSGGRLGIESSGGGASINVTNNINIDQGAGGSEEDKQKFANQTAMAITAKIKEVLGQEKRYGGLLYGGA